MKAIRFLSLAFVALIVVIIAPYVWEYYHPYIVVRCDAGRNG